MAVFDDAYRRKAYITFLWRRFAALGLTLPQCKVLVYLTRSEGISQARRLYLKPRSKPLLDDIWRLADVTRGEAFAGIPRQQAEVFIAVLEKIYGNIVSLGSLQLAALPVLPQKARGGGGPKAARIRRERSHRVR